MPRPEPTKSMRKLESDTLEVRPYATSIMAVGSGAALTIGLVLLFVESAPTVGVVVAAVVLLSTQIIGYLLILAKQVESVHRMNSRLDSLLESAGLNEYNAGKKQGREDMLAEQSEE